jgi:hypothetical protein
MKLVSILLTSLSLFFLDKANATGYKPDPTHRYEHNRDIDKLLHPNHEVHIVQQRRSPKERQPKANHGPKADEEEDYLTGGKRNRNKTLLVGVKNGYVMPKHSEINNVVTNILEASAAVERESVFKFDKK